MSKIKRALLMIFMLLLVSLVVIFVLENQQLVGVTVLGWTVGVMPSAVMALCSGIVGLLCGVLICSAHSICARRRPSLRASR